MTDSDWGVGYAKSLGVLLNGPSLSEPDRHGRQVADSSFYLAFNAWEQPLQFRLPGPKWGGPWQVVVDTSDSKPVDRPEPRPGGKACAASRAITSSCWSARHEA